MAFEKSLELMRLAEMAASRHHGICLVDVTQEFDVNLRTAQRMIRRLEAAFPSVEFSTDKERRRWWKLKDTKLLRMQGIRDSELAALDMSIRRAEREGALNDVTALVSLRDRFVGDASLLPTRVRVGEPKYKPNSATVEFWDRWAGAVPQSKIEQAVFSWRRQSAR